MAERLTHTGIDAGSFRAPQAAENTSWLQRNIKAVSMLVAASAMSLLAACNSENQGPRTSKNQDDINNFQSDTGFEGCEPFSECWLVNGPKGTGIVYEVPQGLNYVVEVSFFDNDNNVIDIKNYSLSGEGMVENPGVYATKVVMKVISPENSKDPVVITSEPVDGNL